MIYGVFYFLFFIEAYYATRRQSQIKTSFGATILLLVESFYLDNPTRVRFAVAKQIMFKLEKVE
jgi:hypothetical protein